jgi:hypothetical protein
MDMRHQNVISHGFQMVTGDLLIQPIQFEEKT